MTKESQQVIKEYMEKYHDLGRFEILTEEEGEFAKRRYHIKEMPTTDVAVRLLNAGIGDVIRDKLFSLYYIVSTTQSAERCQIARDITKDVLRGECGSEYPKSFEDVIKERVMTCPVCGYKIPAHLPLSKMEEHMLEKHPEWFESH